METKTEKTICEIREGVATIECKDATEAAALLALLSPKEFPSLRQECAKVTGRLFHTFDQMMKLAASFSDDNEIDDCQISEHVETAEYQACKRLEAAGLEVRIVPVIIGQQFFFSTRKEADAFAQALELANDRSFETTGSALLCYTRSGNAAGQILIVVE